MSGLPPIQWMLQVWDDGSSRAATYGPYADTDAAVEDARRIVNGRRHRIDHVRWHGRLPRMIPTPLTVPLGPRRRRKFSVGWLRTLFLIAWTVACIAVLGPYAVVPLLVTALIIGAWKRGAFRM